MLASNIDSRAIQYHPEGLPLPIPPFLQRLIRLAPWLIRLPLITRLVLRQFSNVRSSQIAPGFYAVMPKHLIASGVNLNDTRFINYAPVTIGLNTRFSGENLVLTSTHPPDDFSKVIAYPIKIGCNVWITYRCIILGGVTIGDNVIIGAGSVVTKDIPSNAIAAGNPCRVIRMVDQ